MDGTIEFIIGHLIQIDGAWLVDRHDKQSWMEKFVKQNIKNKNHMLTIKKILTSSPD